MLGQATKTCPSLMCWGQRSGHQDKKIINSAKKITGFEAEPDVIGKVSLGIVALATQSAQLHNLFTHSPSLINGFSRCNLGQATKSLQQFFLEPNWAANACLKQILTILIDIWNLTSHIGMGQQETQLPDNTLLYFDAKIGLKHLGATHCLFMLPHTSHLLGQASKAHECKGNPPASCASCAGARHQCIHFGMRTTAWLIHVLKNTPFTSIS